MFTCRYLDVVVVIWLVFPFPPDSFHNFSYVAAANLAKKMRIRHKPNENVTYYDDRLLSWTTVAISSFLICLSAF